MTFIIALLINLLILALIVVVVFWALEIAATAIGFPPKIFGIVKAIIILLALLIFIEILTGGWTGFYPYHH